MEYSAPSRTAAAALDRPERRAAIGLAAIYAIRMLGLFLILPVFTLYAQDYPDYTPLLAGLAIGAYGLSQALLQIPFGVLSDRLGRKPVITAGLLLFALGSAWSALAGSVLGILVGRALVGRALSDRPDHQHRHDDRQHGVERDEEGQADHQIPQRKPGRRIEGR